MNPNSREMWATFFVVLGSVAARKQQEQRDKEALAAIIRFPYKPRVCTKADFVDPKSGPRKFCARCGKSIHAHPKFANVSCSACGCSFGPGNHGFSMCDEHRNNGKGAA